MAEGQLDGVLRYIRRLVGLPSAEGLSDGQLLERFATQQDEAAFEALLQRHGRLVLGVCRAFSGMRMLLRMPFRRPFLCWPGRPPPFGNTSRSAVGCTALPTGWRYVARRTQPGSSTRERQVEPMPASDPMAKVARRELRPVLDQELNRLPEKYRAPLVLCYLQGKTNEQAARELGWPPGTMSRRLARGRELLRIRLTGRGVTLSTGLLATALTQEASAATVPAGLIHATLQAVLLYVAGQATVAGVLSGQALA